MSKAHPGFTGTANSIAARQGISEQMARRILGAGAQKASAAAKKANPRLLKVSGVRPKKGRQSQRGQ
jgi:hypothetical protein